MKFNFSAQQKLYCAVTFSAKLRIAIRCQCCQERAPSRICRARGISLGITTRPRSSARRTIPAAYICFSPLKRRITMPLLREDYTVQFIQSTFTDIKTIFLNCCVTLLRIMCIYGCKNTTLVSQTYLGGIPWKLMNSI